MANQLISNSVLNEILEKSNAEAGLYTEKIFKEILRELISIFGNVSYVDKNNNPIKVKCFHANRERAVAKSSVGDNITLPVITISEESISGNDERRRYSPLLVHEKYWDKRKQRAIRVLSLSPKPLDIKYRINIWTKYKQDLDQIRESIVSLFNPELEIRTKDNVANKAFFDSESTTAEMEADDTEDRTLKKSLSIVIETYVPNPKFLYTSTGKIEKVNYEIAGIGALQTISERKSEEHPASCLCSDCVLPLFQYDGTEFNLKLNCNPLDKNSLFIIDGNLGS